MYLRICAAFVCVLAVVIAAGLLPRKTPVTLPDLAIASGDAGLGSRQIHGLSLDHVSQAHAIDQVRAQEGVSIAYAWEHDGYEPPDVTVSLSLKDVTVGAALRLIAVGSWGTLDGQVIVTGDDKLAKRMFHAYDVRDLVSPPAVSGIHLPESTPPPNTWDGVAGIHGGPRLLALPAVVDEPELSEVLNAVLTSLGVTQGA